MPARRPPTTRASDTRVRIHETKRNETLGPEAPHTRRVPPLAQPLPAPPPPQPHTLTHLAPPRIAAQPRPGLACAPRRATAGRRSIRPGAYPRGRSCVPSGARGGSVPDDPQPVGGSQPPQTCAPNSHRQNSSNVGAGVPGAVTRDCRAAGCTARRDTRQRVCAKEDAELKVGGHPAPPARSPDDWLFTSKGQTPRGS